MGETRATDCDAQLAHTACTCFTSLFLFGIRKNCINRIKHTQITHKEGPESITIHNMTSRFSARLTAAMWSPFLQKQGAANTRAAYTH